MENCLVKSFNGKVSDELFNGEIFDNIFEAGTLIEQWWKDYNTALLNSSPDY